MSSKRVAPRVAPVSRPNRSESWQFPRSARITRREDFDRAFAAGSRHNTRYFTLITCPAEERARLGLVVGRRAARRAVARNRLRRLVRETFRHAGLPALDVVVVARPNIDVVDGDALRGDLERGFRELNQRCVKS